MEEKEIFEWKAYDRPHKTWSKEFYSTVIVLAFLVSVILFAIEGWMPVMVVWALVFMMWMINRVEPRETSYSLTTLGLRTADRLYLWGEMNQFWFESKWGSRLLMVLLTGMPWQIIMVVDPKDEEEIKRIMNEQVMYELPRSNWTDRAVKWLGDKIPLE